MADFAISTKIHKADIPAGKRMLVTSDIHGHGGHLREVLKRADFSEDDILIIVGDLLQKGPNSLDALRYVMELSERGNVYALVGNVDAYVLYLINNLSEENCAEFYKYTQDGKNRWGSDFYLELAEACGLSISCAEDTLRCKEEIISRFSKELTFLSELPTILETQNFVFVHGGLRHKNVADNQNEGMFSLTKYDNFDVAAPHTFEKHVVVGHWPVALYCEHIPSYNPHIDTEKHIISIDGGCGIKEDGQLNLFIIPSVDCEIKETSFISYDKLPVVTALEEQAESENSVCINWVTREISILEKKDEFTFIRHRHSGKELWVPSAYIYNERECRDYTDYVLPVKNGDPLSVIFKTSKGIIAKHFGIVGWYFGKYCEE